MRTSPSGRVAASRGLLLALQATVKCSSARDSPERSSLPTLPEGPSSSRIYVEFKHRVPTHSLNGLIIATLARLALCTLIRAYERENRKLERGKPANGRAFLLRALVSNRKRRSP